MERGDLLAADCDALVNAVNTVGVMGKGIALAFKKRFPEMYADYRRRCKNDELQLGEPYLYRGAAPPAIINFPTKGHWRSNSKLEAIDQGLAFLAERLPGWELTSIALPALGCGAGGLRWADVQPLIETHLGPLDVRSHVYLPLDAS